MTSPREFKTCQFKHASTRGLGIKLFGGVDKHGNNFGIFIRKVIPGGVVATTTDSVYPGDEILAVNGTLLEGATCNRWVKFKFLFKRTLPQPC